MTIEHFQPFEDVSCISYQNLGDFPFLVGGFNPFENYISQNGNLPPNWGENKKYLKPPPNLPCSFSEIGMPFQPTKKTHPNPPLTQGTSHPANQSSNHIRGAASSIISRWTATTARRAWKTSQCAIGWLNQLPLFPYNRGLVGGFNPSEKY